MKRPLSVLLIIALLLSCVSLQASADPEGPGPVDYSILGRTGYVDITEDSEDQGFVWNDSMLLPPATSASTSPDLLKASISLATLAYKQSALYSVLKGEQNSSKSNMGFSIVGGTGSYGARSLSDCDHVGYTIASKETGNYMLYCIPVRGTPEGAEWYSDFKLAKDGIDNGGKHYGFHTAAAEMYAELESKFRTDGSDASHRIVWIMGHSRGAAVSNIISGWLNESSWVTRDHLYSYNFACPAVSTTADTSYTNIRNYNNSDDLVARVPLSVPAWGYKRNGQSFTISRDSNVDDLETFMAGLLPDAYAYNSDAGQIAALIIATHLGGYKGDEVPFSEVREKILYHINRSNLGVLEKYFVTCASAGQFVSIAEALPDNLNRLQGDYDEYIRSVDGLDEDEAFGRADPSLISALEMLLPGTQTITSFFLLKEAAKGIQVALTQDLNLLEGSIGIVKIFTEYDLGNAHLQQTYARYINHRYLGYKGYYDSSVSSFLVDGITVGPYCFANCADLTEVSFADSLKHISINAFDSSAISGELILPEGLVSVAGNAFKACSGLTAIRLPHTTEWLAAHAFECPNVTEVTLPVEIPACDTFDTPNVTAIHYLRGSTGIMIDRRGAGSDSEPGLNRESTLEAKCRTSLSAITFEEGILHIGSEAFASLINQNMCEGALTSVTLPSTLQSIGNSAFRYQNNLRQIALPDGILELGEFCFLSTGLESIAIPGTVETIPEACFRSCSQLQSAEFSEGLKTIGTYAFEGCSALEKLLLPHTLETIEAQAFSGALSVTEISIPIELSGENLTWISGLGPIEKIHYLFGSTGIMPDRSSSFSGALEQSFLSSIKEVDFEEGITRIGDYAFTGWGSNGTGSAKTALIKVTLPSTLTSIGVSAFHGQLDLTEIILPDGLQALGSSCFSETGLRRIDLPASLASLGDKCFRCCKSLGLIRFHGNAPDMDGREVFDLVVAELVWPHTASGWNVDVPSLLCDPLFCHPDDEPVLRLAGNIKVLEESALENVGASIFELSPGIESLGADVFRNTNRDILIRVPESVSSIDSNAFRSDGRVFIAAPENSPAWQFADQNGIYLITATE